MRFGYHVRDLPARRMRMKIVILDGYNMNPGDITWDPIRRFGEVEIFDRTSPDQILERAKDAEIILSNKVAYTKETLEKLPKLRYIGVMATGYNQVDVESATAMGITVTNIPTYGTNAVAQHTFALLLALTIHAESHSEGVKAGKWAKSPDYSYWDYPLTELAGKTLGIIGFGRIGQMVGRIALAFGMRVLAVDNYRNAALETEGLKYADLDELYAKSDVITLHCPLTEANRWMINRESIAMMKDGVKIINTSRGPLVNEQDLYDALNSGKVGAAGLDVLNQEPPAADNPLYNAKNIIITPHIAWAPRESRLRLLAIAEENIEKFLSGKPINVVTKR